MINQTALVVHGGAGTLLRANMTQKKEEAYTLALEEAISAGSEVLLKGGTAVEAVTEATKSMEDCPLFNAGKGSVFTSEGGHEMDACIMNGSNLEAGSVAGVHGIRNPIVLAKEIMEYSDHVMLIGKGAMEYARLRNLEFKDESYFYDKYRYDQWIQSKKENRVQLDHSTGVRDEKFGTVGAVALDKYGNIAAATSTGGMTNKKYGRVGDSPLIGSGNYANNRTCAISCTGHGEFFIRGVVAYDVSCLIEYKGLSLQEACNEVVQHRLPMLGGDGGVIAVNTEADLALVFNSPGMYRGYQNNKEPIQIAIYGEDERSIT